MTKAHNAELLDRLINGKEAVRRITLEPFGEVDIRPIDAGEQSTVSALQMKCLNIDFSENNLLKSQESLNLRMNLNMEIMSRTEDEAIFKIVASGLSCKGAKITVDNVKKMKVSKDDLKKLAYKILEISHVSMDDLLPFHGQLGELLTSGVDLARKQAGVNGKHAHAGAA